MAMTDSELLSIVTNAEYQATIHNSEYSRINERALKDYLQMPYGDEVRDQSQVISPDVQDVVESDMPSLARVFLGPNQPVEFEANRPEEEEEVREKNLYIHHLIRNQRNSYQTLYSWMKDAEIQSCGVVKYYVEDVEKTEEISYENVVEEDLSIIAESLEGEDVKSVDVAYRDEQSEYQEANGVFNVTFKVTKTTQKYCIDNVPTEQFLISKGAADVDSAEMVGDTITKTRGQLLAEGHNRKLVESLPSVSGDRSDTSTLSNIRNKDTGEDFDTAVRDWANEIVEMRDLYIMVDYDQDGIAERRRILKSGNQILINEAFDHVPYAVLSGILMPHKAIGRSRGQTAQQTQRTKTVIKRQMLDNMYSVNRPRNIVHPDVHIDDMLNIMPNGIIRMKSSTEVLPGQAVQPIVTPPMMSEALQVIQYLDTVRAQSTGTYMASQGLDADAISKETATRFTGIQEKGDEKIELVARTFAETGWAKLYEGMCWLVSHYQSSATEIAVLGKPLKVDPTKWKNSHMAYAKVGLGAGNKEKAVMALQGILAIQQQLAAQGSPLVDQVKFFNTLNEITSGVGYKNTEKFFNNPEQPEELLLAENEILKKTLQQLQMQQQQNPLAEAELIRAQAKLTEASAKTNIEAAKLEENMRQFNAKITQQSIKENQDMALKLTDMEQKYNQQLNSEVSDNVLTYDPATGTFKGKA